MSIRVVYAYHHESVPRRRDRHDGSKAGAKLGLERVRKRSVGLYRVQPAGKLRSLLSS